jgi:hypothetical protein
LFLFFFFSDDFALTLRPFVFSQGRYRCVKGHDWDVCSNCHEGIAKAVAPKPKWIKPGMPEETGLPVRDLKDARSGKLWEYQAPYAGQIVFSTAEIEQTMKPKEGKSLATDFKAGDSVYLRAVWPTAFRNLPIGFTGGDAADNNNNTGKASPGATPIYGPNIIPQCNREMHHLQMCLFVRVNDKPVVNQPLAESRRAPGVCAWDQSAAPHIDMFDKKKVHKYYLEGGHANPKASDVDFWAYNLSIRSALLHDNPLGGDDWRAAAGPVGAALAAAGPGKHTVSVELRYRIVADKGEIKYWSESGLVPTAPDGGLLDIFPKDNTKFSHAVAKGSFTVDVPANGVELVSPKCIPRRVNCGLPTPDAERLEAVVSDFMRRSREWGGRGNKTEELMGSVALCGNWARYNKQHDTHNCGVCSHHGPDSCAKYTNEPWRYGIEFKAAFYRSPLAGWEKEMPCAVFTLDAMSYEKDLKTVEDVIGIAVGGHTTFDPDWLPESAFASLGVTRVEEKLRGGL